MREIKFRGKRVANGCWVSGDLMSPESIGWGENPYIKRRAFHYEVLKETVGQYTGLTDEYQTKIYEGDIVSIEFRNDVTRGIVTWNENLGSWCIHLKGERKIGCTPLGEMILCYDMRIIGNIYDNPELIKEDNNEIANNKEAPKKD